ncbi:MAG: hypothetical protein ABSG22_07175 [Sedimentisphaerales bacterium]|jgi:hypothetical protein
MKQHSNSLKKHILHTAVSGPDSSQPRLNRKPKGYLKPIGDAIEIWRGGQGIEVITGVKNLPGLLPADVPEI